MPRGKYDRKKATKRRAYSARDASVAAFSSADARDAVNRAVVVQTLEDQRGQISRLTTERDQYKRWLHDQGLAYLDVLDRLIDIQYMYGGGE